MPHHYLREAAICANPSLLRRAKSEIGRQNRRRRIDEKEMSEHFRNQSPASDQRIAQNQRGVIPDKIVAHSRGIADEDDDKEKKAGPDFFHAAMKSISRASRFANVYVDLA